MNVFILQGYHSPIGVNRTKNYRYVAYIFITLEINILYRNVYVLYIQ